MTLIIKHNTLTNVLSISIMETSEFEIIINFKVVDLIVLFNLKFESLQSKNWVNSYSQKYDNYTKLEFLKLYFVRTPFKVSNLQNHHAKSSFYP